MSILSVSMRVVGFQSAEWCIWYDIPHSSGETLVSRLSLVCGHGSFQSAERQTRQLIRNSPPALGGLMLIPTRKSEIQKRLRRTAGPAGYFAAVCLCQQNQN